MKSIVIAIVTLLVLSAVAVAQTTREEYNYVTKGYKVQIESGLDMKKGYEVKYLDNTETEKRTATLNTLYRIDGPEKEVAAFMVVYKKKGNPTEYICIPHPQSDEEILERYWVQLYDGVGDSSRKLQLISYLISKHMDW